MISQTMNYSTDNRILSFWGYENSVPSAIGQVQVDLSCIKGVTAVETVEEPILVDVATIDTSSQAAVSNEELYYIIAGCVGFLMLVALTVTLVMCKLKKACFKTHNDVNITQTMPIENFGGY